MSEVFPQLRHSYPVPLAEQPASSTVMPGTELAVPLSKVVVIPGNPDVVDPPKGMAAGEAAVVEAATVLDRDTYFPTTGLAPWAGNHDAAAQRGPWDGIADELPGQRIGDVTWFDAERDSLASVTQPGPERILRLLRKQPVPPPTTQAIAARAAADQLESAQEELADPRSATTHDTALHVVTDHILGETVAVVDGLLTAAQDNKDLPAFHAALNSALPHRVAGALATDRALQLGGMDTPARGMTLTAIREAMAAAEAEAASMPANPAPDVVTPGVNPPHESWAAPTLPVEGLNVIDGVLAIDDQALTPGLLEFLVITPDARYLDIMVREFYTLPPEREHERVGLVGRIVMTTNNLRGNIPQVLENPDRFQKAVPDTQEPDDRGILEPDVTPPAARGIFGETSEEEELDALERMRRGLRKQL